MTDVYLIDDDPEIQQTLGLALSMGGFRAHGFESAPAAIDQFAQQPASIVLIDYTMPEISGPEIGKKLRQLPGGQQARLVMLTGDHSAQVRQQSMAAGIDDVLLKPISIPTLLQQLKQWAPPSGENV